MIGGLEPVQSGTLTVGDHDVASLAGDRLAAYRRVTVGFVFQHFGLLDALTALENVELAMVLAGERLSERRARARALLDDTAVEVFRLLESLQSERGCTLLVVTHDRGISRRAEQVMALDHGRIR